MRISRHFVIRAALGLTLVASGVSSAPALAQAPPEPGPAHEKMGFFVGKWTTEGRIAENPAGMAAGEFSGKDTCEWFDGGFAVVCRSEGKGPDGRMKGMGVIGYSPVEDAYTYWGMDNTGHTMTAIPLGRIEGNKWIFEDESKMGDMMVKSRYLITRTSDDAYTFAWKIQGPDGWTTVMDGTSTRR